MMTLYAIRVKRVKPGNVAYRQGAWCYTYTGQEMGLPHIECCDIPQFFRSNGEAERAITTYGSGVTATFEVVPWVAQR